MKRHMRSSAIVALLPLVFHHSATAERLPSQPITLIRCGALIDGVSSAPRKNVLLRIEGNKITRLTTLPQPFPKETSAQTIDLSSATCLPGLIDVHVHLIQQDTQRRELHTPAQSLSAENLQRTLHYGFTTVRNLGTNGLGPSDVDVRDAVANGSLLGPRLKVALSDQKTRNFGPKGPDGWRSTVDQAVAKGSDWIKLYDADMPGTESGNKYSIDEITTIVDEAHKKGVKVAMHTISFEGSHRAIVGGVDSVEHGVDISDADLTVMKERGISYDPTLFVIEHIASLPGRDDTAKWVDFSKRSLNTYDRALKAKVNIAFGSDAGAAGWTSNPAQQFAVMVRNGLPPMAAIQSGTIMGARLLGMEKQVGSIEVGKLADIVAVPGNPLADIRQMEHATFVMKDGRILTIAP